MTVDRQANGLALGVLDFDEDLIEKTVDLRVVLGSLRAMAVQCGVDGLMQGLTRAIELPAAGIDPRAETDESIDAWRTLVEQLLGPARRNGLHGKGSSDGAAKRWTEIHWRVSSAARADQVRRRGLWCARIIDRVAVRGRGVDGLVR